MSAAVGTGGAAAPVFEAAEQVLDPVALFFVEGGGVFERGLSLPATREAGWDALVGQGVAEPVAVVAPSGDQAGGSRERGHAGRRATRVAARPGREHPAPGLAGGGADCG